MLGHVNYVNATFICTFYYHYYYYYYYYYFYYYTRTQTHFDGLVAANVSYFC